MRNFLSILLLPLFSLSVPAEEISLRLGPKSAPLPLASATPPLHHKVPEAVHPKDGLLFTPEQAFQWAFPDTRKQALRFTIDSDNEIFDHIILTIWNWHNRPVFRKQLSAGQIHQLHLRVDGRGVYQFTLEGYKNGECKKRLVRSAAVTEDLNYARDIWKTDEFFLGICALPGRYHWSYEGKPTLPDGIYPHAARELEAELMANLGFQLVRIDESMEMGEGVDGYQYQFKRMDAAAHAYTSRGVKLALQLMNAPGWAIHPKYKNIDKNAWRYPREEIHQRAYIAALLKRYGKHTQFVQIFNEPDQTQFWSGEPEEFVTQFQYSRDEIQKYAGEKSLPIVNGGYSLFEKEKTAYFAAQLKGKIDMVAYHCHGDLNALIEDFAFVKKLHEKAGYTNTRFVNTEMGFDGWRLDQELRKGQFVPQKTLYCWATGHAGALLFGSRMTLGPNRRSQDFGFLDHYFCPRYVYGSVAAMVSVLAGASFDCVLLEEDNRFVYQFSREDKSIVAAFTLDQSAEIDITSDANAAIQIDAMGNREVTDQSTAVRLKLSNYPVYLELTNAGEVAVVTRP